MGENREKGDKLRWIAGELRHGSAANPSPEGDAEATRAAAPGPPQRAPRVNDLGFTDIPSRLGPYELIEEIGRGAMGIVFRAKHTLLRTACAVKVLLAGDRALPAELARFKREAAAVAKMGKHPHIVQVLDMDIEGALLYYAMELVEGASLRERCRRRPFSPEEAAALLEKIARALHHAHQHEVIHRDVKPDNILLRGEEPQVADFGLARDLGGGTPISRPGQVIGTPAYMSPEQARGLEVDARTDVYSLGVVMYELLARRRLYEARTTARAIEAIVVAKFERPREVRRDLPPALEAICLKALASDPAGRYQTALAMADDLALWLREKRSLAAESAPAPVDGAARRRVRKRREEYEGSLPEGMVLAGYRIERYIGRGAMGEVYQAAQLSLGRLVALKVLSATEARHPGLVARFHRETRALACLSHPNIVSIHDRGQEGDRLFYSMEYVDGADLRWWLGLLRPDPMHLLRWVPQICAALEHAHLWGIIHRDLKPENILIRFFDHVKVADFGVARMLYDRDRTKLVRRGRDRRVVGTVDYVAPEQLHDPSRVDARADLYSLGVITYEMLTGELPVGAFAPPSKKSGLPQAIDEVVLPLLSRDPALRPPGAKAVREAVERILRDAGPDGAVLQTTK